MTTGSTHPPGDSFGGASVTPKKEASINQAIRELMEVMEKHNLVMDVRTSERSYATVVEGIDITQCFKEDSWHYSCVELPEEFDSEYLKKKLTN